MDKSITIDIYLEQTVHDILVECNLIGKNMVDAANKDLQADIMTPDDKQTKSIICRAHTEAFGNVKLACRRYLTTGRLEDDNKLERLAKSASYNQKQGKKQGQWVAVWKYQGMEVWKDGSTYKAVVDDAVVSGATDSNVTAVNGSASDVEYEVVTLELLIPNFDIAVTDALKNHIHKYVVDYVMWRFLQNQADEKCSEYKKLADDEDYVNIERDLTCRDRFVNRQAQWV